MADDEDGGYWLRRAPGPRDVLVWIGADIKQAKPSLRSALRRLESRVSEADSLEWPDHPCVAGLYGRDDCQAVLPRRFKLPRAPGRNDMAVWIGCEVEPPEGLAQALERLEDKVGASEVEWWGHTQHNHCNAGFRQCGVVL